MAKILVAEDDNDIRELLVNFLESDGHTVAAVANGMEAISNYQPQDFELIILDIMMPKVDGYSVLEFYRKASNVPAIFLTALDSEDDQLRGYRLYADDYITKPFSVNVLLEKVSAILRRTVNHTNKNNLLNYKNLCLDLGSYTFCLDNQEVEVTLTEFNLLKTLIEKQGQVLTRDFLLDIVWGYNYYGDKRIVDTHIKNLRKKIPSDYIETTRGVGYRIAKEDSQ